MAEPPALERPRQLPVAVASAEDLTECESGTDSSSEIDVGEPDSDGVSDPASRRTACSALLDILRARRLIQTHQWCMSSPWVLATFIVGIGIIFTGIMLGVYVEGWTVLTSVYVLMQVITTIGYGDVVVSSEGMKLFMSFYVVCVLVMFSHLLNLFVQSWLDKNVKLMQHFFLMAQSEEDSSAGAAGEGDGAAEGAAHAPAQGGEGLGRSRKRAIDWRPVALSSLLMVVSILAGTVFFTIMEPCSCSYGKTEVEGCDSFNLDTCEATGGYRKTVVDAFYMSVITVTTVGFGDHAPRTQEGRTFAIVWCVLGVGCCVNWLRTVTELLVERHRWRDFEYTHMTLNEKVFHKMDVDGTGTLSRDEYLGYVLIKHNFISKGILDYLNDQFDQMDPRSTNQVTYQQLVERQMAMQDAEKMRRASKRRRPYLPRRHVGV